ncbi:carboxymuconolactone decarboxylase family protein [Ammoniphilus sp. YIM 78166]|uniref:carboxymuconolactone decarboxylase family protein n=1 Tax=Ammoniphilus sp. YIM 78166 TaxID=1644106 RepID=UPI001F10BDF3|nr:carboxymuconolactone decarboxylase family protein [Ammoniphilus sp. YIM 78166]
MSLQHEDEYKSGIQELHHIMPHVVDRYNEFTGACFEERAVSKGNKELIALGISLSHRDENCVRYHVTEALHKGVSAEEIWETVNVAMAMSGGMIVSQCVHWVSESLSQGTTTPQ